MGRHTASIGLRKPPRHDQTEIPGISEKSILGPFMGSEPLDDQMCVFQMHRYCGPTFLQLLFLDFPEASELPLWQNNDE